MHATRTECSLDDNDTIICSNVSYWEVEICTGCSPIWHNIPTPPPILPRLSTLWKTYPGGVKSRGTYSSPVRSHVSVTHKTSISYSEIKCFKRWRFALRDRAFKVAMIAFDNEGSSLQCISIKFLSTRSLSTLIKCCLRRLMCPEITSIGLIVMRFARFLFLVGVSGARLESGYEETRCYPVC